MEKVRKHIIFYGTVQGVGFRYTAYHSANRNSVAGWVRNLPDGSVEAEVEGSKADIDQMLADIKGGRFITVERMDVRDIPPKGDISFAIK